MNVRGLSIAALCVLLPARVAYADAADKALAESLFQEARELMEQDRAEAACDKFAESQRLDPALGTLLNLAECHAQVGRVASAWAEFRELAEKSRVQGQSSRAAFAEQRVRELEPRLSYARLQLPDGDTVTAVELDGRRLGPVAWRSRLPLDPGAHTLTIRTRRGVRRSTFQLPNSPGEHAVPVTLPIASTGAVPASSVTHTSAKESRQERSGGDPRKPLGYVSIGLGVVGIGASAYLTARALSLKSESDDHCSSSGCDETGLERYSEAKDAANLATLSGIIGSVALVGGGGLLLWAAGDDQSAFRAGVAGRF
ncbi:MAG: hypothetical protein R3B13_04700 [Polyangiaceae bacterium]